jgi:hypothetical protein
MIQPLVKRALRRHANKLADALDAEDGPAIARAILNLMSTATTYHDELQTAEPDVPPPHNV